MHNISDHPRHTTYLITKSGKEYCVDCAAEMVRAQISESLALAAEGGKPDYLQFLGRKGETVFIDPFVVECIVEEH